MYHTSNIFKEIEGIVPFEYIRKQRLISSAFSLRKKSSRVTDIAFDYMFSSHEGYMHSFSKLFGISPKRFSQTKLSHDWLIPYGTINDFSSKEKLNMKDTDIIFTQIVDRSKRKL